MPATPKLALLSGGAAQGLVEQLAPAFESETGYAIEGVFDAVGAIAARLRDGAPADILILTSQLITELAGEGRVIPDSATAIGSVETAVAVRAGDPRPVIDTAAALRRAVLEAGEIYVPDPQRATAGIHFAQVLKELGVWEEVGGRLRPFANGSTAMAALAAATSARPIGCTQATEILNTPGVEVVGPLPPACALATVYTAAVAAEAASPAAAKRLIECLVSADNRATRQRLGFT